MASFVRCVMRGR